MKLEYYRHFLQKSIFSIKAIKLLKNVKNPYNVSSPYSISYQCYLLEYLNNLVSTIDIFLHDEFCDFFHIKTADRDFLRDM
jgi:hypothetical protein